MAEGETTATGDAGGVRSLDDDALAGMVGGLRRPDRATRPPASGNADAPANQGTEGQVAALPQVFGD